MSCDATKDQEEKETSFNFWCEKIAAKVLYDSPSREVCAHRSSSFAQPRLWLWCDANLQSLVSLDTKLIGKIPQLTDPPCLQRLKGHPGAISKAIFQEFYFRHS